MLRFECNRLHTSQVLSSFGPSSINGDVSFMNAVDCHERPGDPRPERGWLGACKPHWALSQGGTPALAAGSAPTATSLIEAYLLPQSPVLRKVLEAWQVLGSVLLHTPPSQFGSDIGCWVTSEVRQFEEKQDSLWVLFSLTAWSSFPNRVSRKFKYLLSPWKSLSLLHKADPSPGECVCHFLVP